ncbi:MAG: glycosyltransferase family 4 protein [Planctomycetaceae bacterium]
MPSPKPEPLSPPLSIWLVNPFDDIPGEGLPAMRYWSLARVLAARGHDVTWWSATWSHRRKAIRSQPLSIRDDEGFGLRLVAVRPYEKNVSFARIGSHRDFGRSFERLACEAVAAGQLDRPDLIVASLPPLEGPEAALRVGRKLDAAVVVDVQDLWPETFARLVPGPAFLRGILAPWILGGMHARRRTILAAASAVSATAASHLDAIAAEISAATPRHVCPLGAYPQEFPETPRGHDRVPEAGGEPAPPAALECVYSGSLEAGQDLDALVAAAKKLSADGIAARIHVAGTGTLEPMIQRAAAGLTGSCRIVHHGLLGRRDYVRLLSGCDVGLVCVRPESQVVLPNKAGDYAAAGLAIVNSLPGELARLIERYGAGVAYTAGDAASLARAIAGLATDRRRLAASLRAARHLAAAVFDRELLFPAFADWLETIPN